MPANDPDLDPDLDPGLVARLRAAGCVFAEDEAAVLTEAAPDAAAREPLVRRRLAGEPLEHVVGWADFAGVRVAVEPGVFVPRQRTSYLVEVAADALAEVAGERPGVLLDLACGSGALGLALARRRPGLTLHASDLDPTAAACAAANLAPVGGTAHCGDLTAPLPQPLRGTVDVIVANVPYVPTSAVPLMPADSREHEPRTTVDGGPDGLDLLRRVAVLAGDWLREGGAVFCEVSRDQAEAARAAFTAAGLRAVVQHDPERDATVLAGRTPTA
ncbi:putative protein N(5)-glutamine methyltransferase [Nocardioides faecalis]|uniref:putative protein N(5)-glutamine methyltransferase n=1 Tax=Nocardioides faecalis TaxID=2803858 RepID=UPI0027DD4561|nr:putative protein N(5)-glutamine methyltransferase [Nocardioides faecalis]